VALTKNEVVLVLNKLKIPYSNDVIEALASFGIIDERLADQIFKSAFDVATQENRRIVTGPDIEKVLAQMQPLAP
jgi:histone H3/H4